MAEPSWQVIEEVSGSGIAEILRGLLEAQGIEVLVSQEGAGHFGYPVTVGRFGIVQILVPAEKANLAESILAEFHTGELSDIQLEESQSPEDCTRRGLGCASGAHGLASRGACNPPDGGGLQGDGRE